ncbi:VapC toxin family PIN domain ribonuclease [Pseudoduganella sp. FT55W]|uniref:VapC toxin family PIN domain ribonuclease n=1 Tax=Duganella rivi TaxID=2666083 RepID=A0A7X4GL30_9BURK|nr:type II toxin-antitoxin system VapC family toxin [Duganella rivi]MYM65403.1 VapC toxin family PIN domain ribonuclease [Duganella rivi]
MVKALLDSSIVMDAMNGVSEARTEISYYSDISISAVSWMEVAVGCISSNQLNQFQAFIGALGIKVIHTNDLVAFEAAKIRAAGLAERPNKRNIKLPDAIIGATGNIDKLMVVTRNPRDFGASSVRLPYRCEHEYDATGKIIKTTVSDIACAPV